MKPCKQCGQPMASDAAEGLCARCLLSAAVKVTPASSPASPARTSETPVATPDFPDIADPVEVARRLPQFEIVKLLGRGGMGVVYQARQVHLDRVVALKILPPVDAMTPDFVERFRREARSLAKLSHPNIVSVHDFGESGGLYYFAMEFVDGVNLRDTLRAGKMTPTEALAVVPKICDALQYAHEEGVVHRDIKPENILIDRRGRVKIADFGLAKLLRRDTNDHTLTQTGMTLGTPRYMAPEQLDKPESVDHRADIYSLGVVFYEMLTGEVPMGRFAPPSEKVQVDVRLDEIVLHALERDVARRYQHASEIKTDVENVTQASTPVSPAPAAPVPPSPASAAATDSKQEPQPHPAAGFLRAMLLLVVVIGAVAFCWFEQVTLFDLQHGDHTTVRVGAVQPWLVIGDRLTSYAPNFLTVSGFAGLVALVAGIALFCFRRRTVPDVRSEVRRGADPDEPRLSRLAVLGAIWAMLGGVGVLLLPLFANLVRHALSDTLGSAPRGIPPGKFLVFVGVPLLLCASAALGATISGAVALGRIRRSGGRLYGQRLAFADAVFFPLLLLACLTFNGTEMLWNAAFDAPDPRVRTPIPEIVAALVVTVFAGRFAWRKFRPLAASSDAAIAPAAARPRHLLTAFLGLLFIFGFWFGVSFQAKSAADSAGLSKIITIGALDPFYVSESGPRGFHSGFNFFSWSFFALLVAGVAFTALLRVTREDQGKAPRDPGWWRGWWKHVGVWGGLVLIVCIVRTVRHPEEVLRSPGDRTVDSRFMQLFSSGPEFREDPSRIPATRTPGRTDYAYAFSVPANHRIFVWLEWWKDGKRTIDQACNTGYVAKPGQRYDAGVQLVFTDGNVAGAAMDGQTRIDWIFYDPAGHGSSGHWQPDFFAGMMTTTSWGEKSRWMPKAGETVALLGIGAGKDSVMNGPITDEGLRAGRWQAAMLLKARVEPVPHPRAWTAPVTKMNAWNDNEDPTPVLLRLGEEFGAVPGPFATAANHREQIAYRIRKNADARAKAEQMLSEAGAPPLPEAKPEDLVTALEKIP